MTATFEKLHLGYKSFIFFLLQRVSVAFILGVAGGVLYFEKSPILGLLSGSLALDTAGEKMLETYFSYGIEALLLLTVIVFILGFVITWLTYVCYTLTLEEYALKIRRGIINIEEVSIPYRQIQNVDVSRPLVYRLFGVSRLQIISAGTEEVGVNKAEIEGLLDPIDKTFAEEIREDLQERIGVQIVEHTDVSGTIATP